MNAILALLERMNPNLAKSTVYRLIEYVVLAILLVGLYQDASDSLTNAKAARDEQIKGYAVQIGVLHAEANALKEEVEGLKSWNKALSARVNRLEDAAIKGHH